MFLKPRPDPMQEIARVRGEMQAMERRFDALLKQIEDKIDAFLGEKEVAKPEVKPEALAAMPGYVSPSRRKAQRQAASASSTFTEKVIKGAARTIPEEVIE